MALDRHQIIRLIPHLAHMQYSARRNSILLQFAGEQEFNVVENCRGAYVAKCIVDSTKILHNNRVGTKPWLYTTLLPVQLEQHMTHLLNRSDVKYKGCHVPTQKLFDTHGGISLGRKTTLAKKSLNIPEKSCTLKLQPAQDYRKKFSIFLQRNGVPKCLCRIRAKISILPDGWKAVNCCKGLLHHTVCEVSDR